jgi:threonine/homoserine/homoserine lactone efflux protein
MPSLDAYAVFLATAIVLLLVPGPAVLYVVTRSIEMGRAGGLASVAGITTGTVVFVALAAAGLSSLILASTAAFDVVKYVGAAYLILLGVRRLLGRGLDPPGAEAAPRTRRRAYTQGIVVNLTNPKTIVFVFAFLPQFIDTDAHHAWLQVIVLGSASRCSASSATACGPSPPGRSPTACAARPGSRACSAGSAAACSWSSACSRRSGRRAARDDQSHAALGRGRSL